MILCWEFSLVGSSNSCDVFVTCHVFCFNSVAYFFISQFVQKEDLDGFPLAKESDIDGRPMEDDVDGVPMNSEENLDGFPLSKSNEIDIDGVPLNVDIDGTPSECVF